ncbi:MAG TPA: DUF1549 and DUF1553 domain-containing protein [Candidatus Angelobacter sp.]|nr:DUF1549 and DUF1553 domain-containing protein [Candidatus Angelobacter sp.]
MNSRLFSSLGAVVSVAFIGGWAAAGAESNKTAPPPKPPLPALRSLKVEPASLTLEDGRDERRVIVWGETASGQKYDVTSEVEMKPDVPCVDIDKTGCIQPKKQGSAQVTMTLGNLKVRLPVTVKDATVPPVRFVRDIEPVLSRLGCNAGTCHGSAKGKNGFKLSLRGYDPEFDYQALIDDLSGRRFNRVKPEESLMLLKPTSEVPHEGRQPLKPGSREYFMIRDWIAQGTRSEDPVKNRAQSIEVLPSNVELDLPGRSQHVLVLAHYPDGSVRDVTRDAILSSNNGDVAEVKNAVVMGLRRGEAAVLARYEGCYATKLVSVMGDRTGYKWQDVAEYNYIDKQVNAKLRKLKTLPSDLCTDAEFMRRVSLDLTGIPPTPERLRAFLADTAPGREKREKLIDELLASEDYNDYWANKWADLLQCNSEHLGEKGVWVFHNWIRGSIAANKRYDKFVREMLLAEGSSYLNPEVNYYRALRETGKITEDVSQTFLGVRFNCNKCHDHPFEKWTQKQYYEFGAYFARVAIKRGSLGKDNIRNFTGDLMQVPGEEIVYLKDDGEVQNPRTGMDVPPKVPVGEAKAVSKDGDRREPFVNWLTSKENPYFAMAMANRTWSYFFGRGIIEPVDDIRGSNPASNPELLDALTEDFVQSGFDVRHLMRNICLSRTYQLSINKNKWNEDDTVNFSHATPRRLSAEQMLDAIAVATGDRPKFKGFPAGLRSVDLPDGIVSGNDFLTLFGRPKRQSACECERTSNVTLSHALNLINGTTISESLSAPTNRIAKIVEAEKDDKKVIEDIYISVLGRPPTEKEQATVDFSSGGSRLEVAQDLAWALMNSPAFLFNR